MVPLTASGLRHTAVPTVDWSIWNSSRPAVPSAAMSRLARTLVILFVAAILHAGPVAACVCADQMPPDMPCCPDQPQDNGHLNFGLAHSMNVACDPVAAELLQAGTLEMPAPLALPTSIPPAWLARPPAPVAFRAPPVPHDTPPIYLTTLRLRN
jgi:hypothetical protein